jgi:acetyl-CoA acetyltransferase
MRDVAVVAFAQSHHARREQRRNEVEMLMPVLHQVKTDVGLDQSQIDFTCSGSTDYLAGAAFSFVMTLDGVGASPPISESHVEMDGAWALYEAWVKIQTGAADTALVYSYGKASPGSLRDVLSRQLDPYYVAPLWPDSVALAALQARACIEAGVTSVGEMAKIAARSRRSAAANPFAQLQGSDDPDVLLKEPEVASPLRRHDCPPIGDGAAAIILAAGDRARELVDQPAWIRGIDHRIEAHGLGVRDLTSSPSTRLAGERAGAGDGRIDVAELHAPFSHQEVVLRDALGLGDGVALNPSGGPLAANPIMAAGLIRIGEAATRIRRGEARRAVAHATSGPCLQQNLVCVLEGPERASRGARERARPERPWKRETSRRQPEPPRGRPRAGGMS